MGQTGYVIWIAAILIIGVALFSYPPSTRAAGDSNNGKVIYEKHCAHCHGPQGKGDGPTGRLLKPPAADFTGQASRKKTGADLRKIIENGRPGTGMAPWKGQLTDAAVADVLAYLATLRQ